MQARIWIESLPYLSAVLVFLLFILLLKDGKDAPIVIRKYEELTGFLRGKSKESNWYRNEEIWLQKHGAAYHYGKKMTPAVMLMLRVLAASVGGVIGMLLWGIIGAMVFGGVLLYLPKGLLWYLNGRDNEKMVADLQLVYHAMEIQIRAGVYVTDALAECYGCVNEKRLKQALLDMASDIVMKADIYESLEKFQGKFENAYIDALCITLLQALESGQAVELLGDLAEQIKDLEMNILRRKKNALDRSITFYQLGILTSILGVVLYACITQMFTAVTRF